MLDDAFSGRRRVEVGGINMTKGSGRWRPPLVVFWQITSVSERLGCHRGGAPIEQLIPYFFVAPRRFKTIVTI